MAGRGITPCPVSTERSTRITVLALDQATKKTGWSVFKDFRYAQCGLIDCDDRKLAPEDRFDKMCKALCDLIDSVNPNVVVMEDVAFQNNAAALISLARLQGVVIAKCLLSNIELYIYPPSSWRRDMGFRQGPGVKRHELKTQAVQYIEEHFGISAEEDICEAICIGAGYTIMQQKGDVL